MSEESKSDSDSSVVSGSESITTHVGGRNLKRQITKLSKQVKNLREMVQSLKKENNVDKIEYNLEIYNENYFKLFIHFIKSISSIYIYILLGDEYEELYNKIENLLNVNPFEQQKNYDDFTQVINPYPNITIKTKIKEIFLYQNGEVKTFFLRCLTKLGTTLFRKFLKKKECQLFNFYLKTDGSNQYGVNTLVIKSVLYLDEFKDEEIQNEYEGTRELFNLNFKQKFPEIPPIRILLFENQGFSDDLQVSHKRFRNYSYFQNIASRQLSLRGDIVNIFQEKLKPQCPP